MEEEELTSVRLQSKTYHWVAFIGAQALCEIPYLIICATVYFACWYFTCGFPVKASVSGHVYLQMICELSPDTSVRV